MGSFGDHIDDDTRAVIERQHVFFVATAAAEGRINLSPKGMDTLRVLDERTVAYLDYTGSGNETAAHIANDGRLTMMLCSFDRRPDIVRLYGRGRTIPRGGAEWEELSPRWEVGVAARQLIVLDVELVQRSCGYAVPVMELVAERDTLRRFNESVGEDAAVVQQQRNRRSLDGLVAPPMQVG